MMEYILIRSKRRTVGINIKEDATVVVRAPLKVPKSEIDRIVESKKAWIKAHLTILEQRIERRAAFTLNYGDSVLLQGREYSITANSEGRAGFDGENFYLPPYLPSKEIKSRVMQAYRITANKLLTPKAIEYAKLMKVTPANLRINNAKTRWGSCSGKNSINFSWRIIMADDDVIDYIVVHELAHIKEHNHSERFWATVESVLPDYRECKEKLKTLQKRLSAENWD